MCLNATTSFPFSTVRHTLRREGDKGYSDASLNNNKTGLFLKEYKTKTKDGGTLTQQKSIQALTKMQIQLESHYSLILLSFSLLLLYGCNHNENNKAYQVKSQKPPNLFFLETKKCQGIINDSLFLYTCQKNYCNEDSFGICEIQYSSLNVPETEILYSQFSKPDYGSNELGYGLYIFYDTVPNIVKHVELVAIAKSKSGKRYKVLSQNYLMKNFPNEYSIWLKKTQPDNTLYPIDTYH